MAGFLRNMSNKKSRWTRTAGVNERTLLLKSIANAEGANCKDLEEGETGPRTGKEGQEAPAKDVAAVISILLIGVFIANADGSLVLATSGTISSEFNDLNNAGWLITSYTLAMCATQSVYGKFSDIYGRKGTILTSYIFFGIGCAICCRGRISLTGFISGLGRSINQVILGRAVAGIGGAGINCLVSIVIADLVPLRDVASWRSYANIAATTGRMMGGPLGGYLTDYIGWRWSFLGQVPPTLMALALVYCKLKISNDAQCSNQSHLAKICRIDFLGAIFLSMSVVCGLLVLDLGGKRNSWTDPTMTLLLGGSFVSLHMFLLVEAFHAKEPIFPLRLLRNRDVITSYINLGFTSGAQGAMMMLVPMYFQVSAHASLTNAGAHLMPSVMGNAVAGLLTGFIIKKTGRYKILSVIGALSSIICYTLLVARWHGHTSFLESLYIVPGGFGNGIALSTTFIALTAGVDVDQMAVASSGLFLASNVGMVSGISIAAAILQSTLRKQLRISLEGLDGRDEIITKALSDIRYVRGLRGTLGTLVTNAYIKCLAYTHGVSLLGAAVALISALCIREHHL